MVGEDTVKTNSRFYFTKAPDSVPSFLDGLLSDVLAQTREADLYAMTGTRNYWLPEAIDYTQGSDHDVFLGLGVPSTMLGHDPDWTHHSSEDKIDKTDASEFKRVGVFASAAAYFLALDNPASWNRLTAAQHASRVSELSSRVAIRAGSPTESSPTRINREQLANEIRLLNLSSQSLDKTFDPSGGGSINLRQVRGPRRLTILPLDASAFEGVSPEDGKWLAEQEARFSSDSEGLATKANFGLISFEAVNFMDGYRSTAEIANLISAEYLMDIDQAWVDRLVSILEKQKLVAK